MATKDTGMDVTTLPSELALLILRYLDEIDLCHVAMASRAWREAANRDSLWRLLCRRKGWGRYGTRSDDITKETPYVPLPSSADQGVTDDSTSMESGANTTKTKTNPKSLKVLNPAVHRDVAFKEDSIIDNGNTTGLVGTCRWKEIFMKVRHLENNWSNQNYNVASFDLNGYTFKSYEYNDSHGHVKGDGDYIAACVTTTLIKVWNVKIGTERQISLEKELEHGTFSRTQNSLQVKNGIVVIGCKDGIIRAFSVSTGEELQVMKGHKATEVVDVLFDGETIVSRAESDNDIRVWNLADGTCQHILNSPSEHTEVKYLDYRDNMAAAVYSDDCVRLWDTRSGKCVHSLQKRTAKESALSLCKLGDHVVVCGDSPTAIHIWSKQSGECVAAFTPKTDDEEDSDDDAGDIEFVYNFHCFHGLFMVEYFDGCNGAAYLVYDEIGRRLNKGEFGYGMMPIIYHGNRCVFKMEDRYHLDECHLHKVTNEGLEHMWQMNDPNDTERTLAVLWMDCTKLLLKDTAYDGRFEDRYIVCHFW